MVLLFSSLSRRLPWRPWSLYTFTPAARVDPLALLAQTCCPPWLRWCYEWPLATVEQYPGAPAGLLLSVPPVSSTLPCFFLHLVHDPQTQAVRLSYATGNQLKEVAGETLDRVQAWLARHRPGQHYLPYWH